MVSALTASARAQRQRSKGVGEVSAHRTSSCLVEVSVEVSMEVSCCPSHASGFRSSWGLDHSGSGLDMGVFRYLQAPKVYLAPPMDVAGSSSTPHDLCRTSDPR